MNNEERAKYKELQKKLWDVLKKLREGRDDVMEMNTTEEVVVPMTKEELDEFIFGQMNKKSEKKK